jgi:DNA-binding transcriptional regulator YiaG
MGLSNLLLKGAVATLLSLGTPSTPSSHLRPMRDLYDPGAGSMDQVIPRAEQSRLPGREPITQFVHPRTDDSGAKLAARPFADPEGTGVVLLHLASEHPRDVETRASATTRHVQLVLPPHTQAVRWILEATRLSEDRVGELLGVSRITIRDWKMGKPIRESNLRRLLETKDVLQRAERQHPSRGALVAWLDMPDPVEGTSPARLFEQGDLARARLLAVLSPASAAPSPSWAMRSTPTVWSSSFEEPERSGEFLDGTL